MVLVWWLGIRLIISLLPGQWNVLLLDHKFTMSSQVKYQLAPIFQLNWIGRIVHFQMSWILFNILNWKYHLIGVDIKGSSVSLGFLNSVSTIFDIEETLDVRNYKSQCQTGALSFLVSLKGQMVASKHISNPSVAL